MFSACNGFMSTWPHRSEGRRPKFALHFEETRRYARVWRNLCSESLLEVDMSAASRYPSYCVAHVVMEKNVVVLPTGGVKSAVGSHVWF